MAEQLREIPGQEITPEEFNPEKAESDLKKALKLIAESDMSAEQRAELSPEQKRLNDAYELETKNVLSGLSRALDSLEKLKTERENN